MRCIKGWGVCVCVEGVGSRGFERGRVETGMRKSERVSEEMKGGE